jgi:hypothetical protein
MIVFVEIITILRIYNAILFSHQLPDEGFLAASAKKYTDEGDGSISCLEDSGRIRVHGCKMPWLRLIIWNHF